MGGEHCHLVTFYGEKNLKMLKGAFIILRTHKEDEAVAK